jgi:predicted alpha/beta-hydrolase family hydrolase
MKPEPLKIEVADGETVSGLWLSPSRPHACLALAHGAGAGMVHRSMAAIAEGLEGLGVATLRYQFPYMEKGRRRPDRPAVAYATIRAAAAEATRRAGHLPLFAGGRSFGGRMTSQAQADHPLPGVEGLVFFAFPLHQPGNPSVARAEHLARIAVPMLFLQGSNDAFAQLDLLKRIVAGLRGRAELELIAEADHGFHVPARTGRKDPEVLAAALAVASRWMRDKPSGESGDRRR